MEAVNYPEGVDERFMAGFVLGYIVGMCTTIIVTIVYLSL